MIKATPSPVSRILLAAVALVLALAGCQKNHEKNVNAASERYKQLRSGLVLQMAQQRFDTGDLDLAEKDVRDALTVDPENARLLTLAGRIALEKSQLERAFHLFEAAIKANPKLPDAHYYQGVVLQRWQQHDRAHACYQQAYTLQPDHPPYLLAMAEMLVALGRRDEAIDLLESKLVYFDQHAGIRLSLAQMYEMSGDMYKAADFYRQAVLLRPEDDRLAEQYALVLIAAGRHADATRALGDLLKKPGYSQRDDLKRALANVQLQAGQLREARQGFIDLTRAHPHEVNDWLRLAEVCWAMKDAGGTLSAANRVISLAPQRHEGYLLAGLVWQKRGRLEESLRMFDRAAEAAPQDAAPLILRGLALEKAGRGEAAAQAYREALQRQPDDERASRLLDAVTASAPTP